jgi:hypothetical protein
VTEKAFPENEAVLTLAVSRGPEKAIANELLYERRVGRRGQWELAIPVVGREENGWHGGIGGFRKSSVPRDIAVVGDAAEDADFGAVGDKIRYSVAVGTAEPHQIEVAVMFQPIGFAGRKT